MRDTNIFKNISRTAIVTLIMLFISMSSIHAASGGTDAGGGGGGGYRSCGSGPCYTGNLLPGGYINGVRISIFTDSGIRASGTVSADFVIAKQTKSCKTISNLTAGSKIRECVLDSTKTIRRYSDLLSRSERVKNKAAGISSGISKSGSPKVYKWANVSKKTNVSTVATVTAHKYLLSLITEKKQGALKAGREYVVSGYNDLPNEWQDIFTILNFTPPTDVNQWGNYYIRFEPLALLHKSGAGTYYGTATDVAALLTGSDKESSKLPKSWFQTKYSKAIYIKTRTQGGVTYDYTAGLTSPSKAILKNAIGYYTKPTKAGNIVGIASGHIWLGDLFEDVVPKVCSTTPEYNIPKCEEGSESEQSGYFKDYGEDDNEEDWNCIFRNSSSYTTKTNNYCTTICREDIEYNLPDPNVTLLAGQRFSIGDIGEEVYNLGGVSFTGKSSCRTLDNQINHEKFKIDFEAADKVVRDDWVKSEIAKELMGKRSTSNCAYSYVNKITYKYYAPTGRYDCTKTTVTESCVKPLIGYTCHCKNAANDAKIDIGEKCVPNVCKSTRKSKSPIYGDPVCTPEYKTDTKKNVKEQLAGYTCTEIMEETKGTVTRTSVYEPEISCPSNAISGSCKYSSTTATGIKIYSSEFKYKIKDVDYATFSTVTPSENSLSFNTASKTLKKGSSITISGFSSGCLHPKYRSDADYRYRTSPPSYGIFNGSVARVYENYLTSSIRTRDGLISDLFQCNNYYRTYTEFNPIVSFNYFDKQYGGSYQLEATKNAESYSEYYKNGVVVGEKEWNMSAYTNNNGEISSFPRDNSLTGSTATIKTWKQSADKSWSVVDTTYQDNDYVKNYTTRYNTYGLTDDVDIYKYISKSDGVSHNTVYGDTSKSQYYYLPYNSLPLQYSTEEGSYQYVIDFVKDHSGAVNLFGKNQKFYRYATQFTRSEDTITETATEKLYKQIYTAIGSSIRLDSGSSNFSMPSDVYSKIGSLYSSFITTECYQKHQCQLIGNRFKCSVYFNSVTGGAENATDVASYTKVYTQVKSCFYNGQKKYSITGPLASSFGAYVCDYEVKNRIVVDDFNGKLYVVYRPISLENPFSGQNGTTRQSGSNWTEEYKELFIENNRGVKGEEVYHLEPLYQFVLNSANIKKIREYNQKNPYEDFELECLEGTGKNCKSNFLKEGNNKYFSFTKENGGKCYGTKTVEEFQECRCTELPDNSYAKCMCMGKTSDEMCGCLGKSTEEYKKFCG